MTPRLGIYEHLDTISILQGTMRLMMTESKMKDLTEAMNKIVDMFEDKNEEICPICEKELEEELAEYNNKYLSNLYGRDEVAAIRKKMFQMAINGDFDACAYILDNCDEF